MSKDYCKNLFDLEQKIMQCWNVTDDIDMLYQYFGDDPFFKGMDPKHADEIMNCMLGLHHLYKVKFEQMWHTFEEVVGEYHTYRKLSGEERTDEILKAFEE
jgi:hypothetical protein